MGTLLSESIFREELLKARDRVVQKFGCNNVSSIQLPWAGERLLNPAKGTLALYFVGIGPAGFNGNDGPVTFAVARTNLEQEWRDDPKGKQNVPFFRFFE